MTVTTSFGTMEVWTTLTKYVCGNCGGLYAIAQKVADECYKKGTGWYCPYCQCSWGYFGDTALKRAKERADQAEARTRQTKCSLRKAQRSLYATRGVVTRTKNRIKNGVCPCCNRQFANLHRHMTNQHPEYGE